MKIRQGLLKYVSPSAPVEARKKAADLTFDEELAPEDEITVLVVLSYDKAPEVSGAANKSLDAYQMERMLSALDEDLDPAVIRKLVNTHGSNDAVLLMAALNPAIDDATLRELAEKGPEEMLVAMTEEVGLMRKKPFLIDAMKKNPVCPRTLLSIAEEELRSPKKAAPVPANRKLDKELVLEKEGRADEQNIFKLVQNLTMAQKIKLAITGNKPARELLVKDSNKVISGSVLKNPRITEEEILKLANVKGTSEDLLRQIGRNKEWLKNYNVKFGMVTNPKTPLQVSVKLLDHLHEKDLEKLGKSKNIPSVLAATARRKLATKKK